MFSLQLENFLTSFRCRKIHRAWKFFLIRFRIVITRVSFFFVRWRVHFCAGEFLILIWEPGSCFCFFRRFDNLAGFKDVFVYMIRRLWGLKKIYEFVFFSKMSSLWDPFLHSQESNGAKIWYEWALSQHLPHMWKTIPKLKTFSYFWTIFMRKFYSKSASGIIPGT